MKEDTVSHRSNCLVPLSHLPAGNVEGREEVVEGTNSCDSFEVVVSYKVDSPRGGSHPVEQALSPALQPVAMQAGSPEFRSPMGSNGGQMDEENVVYTPGRGDVEEYCTPERKDSPRDPSMPDDVGEPAATNFINPINDATDAEMQRLRLNEFIRRRSVDIDIAAITRQVVARVLSDAAERHGVVTLTYDGDSSSTCSDLDEVDHEFEPIELEPHHLASLDESIVNLLDQVDGSELEVPWVSDPWEGATPLATSEIEAFNLAMRFVHIRDNKKHVIIFSDSSKYSRDVNSYAVEGAGARENNQTVFKESPIRDAQNENQEQQVAPAKNGTPKEEPAEGNQKDGAFGFLRKRARDQAKPGSALCWHHQIRSKSPSPENGAALSREPGEGAKRPMQSRRGDESEGRKRLAIGEFSNNGVNEGGLESAPYRVNSDIRTDQSNASLDLSLSYSRPSTSSSVQRGSSSIREGVAKRGRLVDTRNSPDLGGCLRPSRPKLPGDRLFDNSAQPVSDWSSETWGSFINVIHSRKRTLGHGSFSTVSFAFLRLTPSLQLGAGMPYLSSSTNNILNGALKEISNGGAAVAGEEQGGSSGQVQSADVDMVDQMCSIINENCTTCNNVRTLDCAVKSINDVFPQARFQYIREKEMMMHFHANVLKPIACRFQNNDRNRAYQLLMPKAQGDLFEMLKRLICHRTENTHSPLYITNQATGKQERRLIGLTETEVKFLFFQVLSGLAFIQMCFQGDIYRHSDVKLQNILVFCSSDDRLNPMRWRLCLADFGCSIMLHPTQHLEGAGLFRNLQETIAKEWRRHLCSQMTSFVRGTVRCNAPETLSYDRHGNARSNRNSNLLTTCRRNKLKAACTTEEKLPTPRLWLNNNVSEDMTRLSARSVAQVAGASGGDTAEYFAVDMRSDMWSAGIVLAELAKFGGTFPSASSTPTRRSAEAGERGSRKPAAEPRKHKAELTSTEHVMQRINSTLGRGIFCRSTSSVRQRRRPEVGRDRPHNSGGHSVLTDENLNLALAAEIAVKCDQDARMRQRNLQREYCWWEYPTFSEGFWSLLANLLSYKPRERYIAAEALGHAWFDSSDGGSRPIFEDIDSLMSLQHRHLPMEHFYYIGSSISPYQGLRRAPPAADGSPFTVKREALMHVENCDLTLESIGRYGKAGWVSHAWFAGPVHYRLRHLGEPGIVLPDYVAQICQRELSILESREKELFGVYGYVLSKLLTVKRRHVLSWADLMLARSVHLLGKSLMPLGAAPS
ncbi:protein kinase domain containing protein [Babesia caballi]|uniref:Protein kinase domain containing protein n=1 Tax=Babesia caballi TaxID=5871 RepID=A0AAV4LUC6_BABCB|nr:protein kinase domain containing protein [Babesia caballi]